MRRRKGKRTGEALSAKDLLPRVLAKRGVRKELRAHRVVAHWDRVVGEKIAARSVPDGLVRGTLWVRVDSAAWMHQLSFLRSEIARKANEVLGDPPLVGEVRIHMGEKRTDDENDLLAGTHEIRRTAQKGRALPPPATGDALARIEAEVSTVADDELREILLEQRRRLNL